MKAVLPLLIFAAVLAGCSSGDTAGAPAKPQTYTEAPSTPTGNNTHIDPR